MKKYIFWYGIVFVFFSYFSYIATFPVQALVKVPVCDLVGDSYTLSENGNSAVLYYNNLPLCGQRIQDCPRIHQLLYNEIVTILDEKAEEYLVKVPSIFYEREKSSERFDTYWALKKNFITFDDLTKLGIPRSIFPDPLDYTQNALRSSGNKIVVLLLPFYDSKTKNHYSVGTRFVMANSIKQRLGHTVYFFDATLNRFATMVIPFNLCRIENMNEPFQKKVNDYVALLRRWTKQGGFIPYVWGGSSCINYCLNDKILLVNKSEGGYYHRLECAQTPKSGFDCAGLIVRAAQICGLPYYYKNSITIKKNLEVITQKDKLREGDILWIPGHVMVVASLKHNTLIEARGYSDGYGKIHEIALDKVFEGLKTFDQLLDHYKEKKTLLRLNTKGEVTNRFNTFALFSLESINKKNS